MRKKRNSENKFDVIYEVKRYFNYPLKDITKAIYKKLESLGL